MAVKVYKNGAWQDVPVPKISTGGVMADTTGRVFKDGAWVDVWNPGIKLNYGVASNNEITQKYKDVLRAYNFETKKYVTDTQLLNSFYTLKYGNYDKFKFPSQPFFGILGTSNNPVKLISGEVDYANDIITSSGKDLFLAFIRWGGGGGYFSFSNFRMKLQSPNGVYIDNTLKYLAENGHIEPLVAISSNCSNALGMYSGSNVSGNYTAVEAFFMPKKDYKVISMHMNSSKDITWTYDGYVLAYIPNVHFCL